MVEAGQLDPAAAVSETVLLVGATKRFEAMTGFETIGIPVIDEF